MLWEKAKDFIQRAFTIIFVATVVIWFLRSFDSRLNFITDSTKSLLAGLGQLIAPLFRPLGFGDWRMVSALVTGITAKEAVVSTMAVIMNTSTENLRSVLSTVFTPVTAASFLAFTLLYTPCVAAIATIRREYGSKGKTLLIVLMQCTIAWAAAFLVYHIAMLFG